MTTQQWFLRQDVFVNESVQEVLIRRKSSVRSLVLLSGGTLPVVGQDVRRVLGGNPPEELREKCVVSCLQSIFDAGLQLLR